MKHISDLLPFIEKKNVDLIFAEIPFINCFGQQFLCPICKFTCVHFEKPVYKSGNDNHGAWEGRGDAIRIPMWCENDHRWTLRIGFHKGESFVSYEYIEIKRE